MTVIGRLNRLIVVKDLDQGVYLDGEDRGEILLPRRYVPQDCNPGSSIEVFIYRDSGDRIIATTQKPFAMVGQFAALKVVSVNSSGAFLDCGLDKDLLVPFREQKQKMEEGRSYVVFVYIDDKTDRIAASSKLDKFLGRQTGHFQQDQEVELLVCEQTEIGYKAIINNTHWGILYKNEVFGHLEQGRHIQGYIKKVRDDGKIDLSLHKPGYEKVDDLSGRIIHILREQRGFIPITDKSSPEIIYDLFGVSKKTYKKAIGALYKKRVIILEEDGIRLIDERMV
jgi:predicted RNA-binding protein (virulence factor B family)